jgi:hypothetical protein
MEAGERTTAPRRWARRAAIALCVALVGLAACSGDDDDRAEPSARATTTTTARPAGPEADVSTALRGGDGPFIAEGSPFDLRDAGYVEHEYAASGDAVSYAATQPLTNDGRWSFTPGASAPYRTRILVRAPADPADFSGNVIVEWLNVSGGVDADPDWVSLREELTRAGDAWVGVSAQLIGVEGGPVVVRVSGVAGAELAGKGLKAIDPERYGTLQHPGDGYSFDIYTQVARAVRAGSGLDGLNPKRVIAAGESQSAFALVTYVNGVQPLTHAFDAFFVHSRGGSSLPLVEPGGYADIAGSIGGQATTFRTDQEAPILDIQTETDVTSILGSYAARQPDGDRFRLWEVAGTAHADAHLVGDAGGAINCGVPINNGPMHVVAKAAWHSLVRWLTTGTPPPKAPRLETTETDGKAQITRDADGIALGGIRTPPVDVPVAALSGAPGPDPSTICLLLGSSAPFSDARIAELYPSRDVYVQKYEASTDATIKAGFALRADREALLAFAEPSRVGS